MRATPKLLMLAAYFLSALAVIAVTYAAFLWLFKSAFTASLVAGFAGLFVAWMISKVERGAAAFILEFGYICAACVCVLAGAYVLFARGLSATSKAGVIIYFLEVLTLVRFMVKIWPRATQVWRALRYLPQIQALRGRRP